MNPTIYQKSTLKKLSRALLGKEVKNVIRLLDEEDGSIIDNVIFLELQKGEFVGFYMNGTNPLVSQNKFDEVDDFNLFSIYDEISEAPQKDFLEFKIVAISTIFHPDYNEILAISLKANNQRTISLIFSQDEISPYENLTSEALDSETRSKLMHYCDVNFAKYDVTLQNVDAILIN